MRYSWASSEERAGAARAQRRGVRARLRARRRGARGRIVRAAAAGCAGARRGAGAGRAGARRRRRARRRERCSRCERPLRGARYPRRARRRATGARNQRSGRISASAFGASRLRAMRRSPARRSAAWTPRATSRTNASWSSAATSTRRASSASSARPRSSGRRRPWRARSARRFARRRAARVPSQPAVPPLTSAPRVPDVTIAIGTIEVRGAGAPAAPPPARAHRPRLSLDEYLASRSGATMSNALGIATVLRVIASMLDDAVSAAGVSALGTPVTSVRSPDQIVEDTSEASHLNLFLYLVAMNSGWKNVQLPVRTGDGARAGRPPLAVDLHFLLAATVPRSTIRKCCSASACRRCTRRRSSTGLRSTRRSPARPGCDALLGASGLVRVRSSWSRSRRTISPPTSSTNCGTRSAAKRARRRRTSRPSCSSRAPHERMPRRRCCAQTSKRSRTCARPSTPSNPRCSSSRRRARPASRCSAAASAARSTKVQFGAAPPVTPTSATPSRLDVVVPTTLFAGIGGVTAVRKIAIGEPPGKTWASRFPATASSGPAIASITKTLVVGEQTLAIIARPGFDPKAPVDLLLDGVPGSATTGSYVDQRCGRRRERAERVVPGRQGRGGTYVVRIRAAARKACRPRVRAARSTGRR